jgi:hypothetical protein
MVRFSIFEMLSPFDAKSLAAEFEKGNAPSNPVIGYLIGTMSVWLKDECQSSPPGRLLACPSQQQNQCSVALASVDPLGGLISLDLVKAIPKNAPRIPPATDVSRIGPNVDVGTLYIINGGTNQKVASFTRDPNNYWKFGRIVDVALEKGVATGLVGNQIVLTDNAKPSNYTWAEEPYRIESDQRTIYLDDPSKTTLINLKVSQYGAPTTAPVGVTFATESSSFFPQQYPDPQNIVFNGSPTATQVTLLPGHAAVTVNVSTNGNPGMSQMDFGVTGPAGSTNAGTYLACIKVFPLDDYSQIINTDSITWDFIYKEVLKYYYLIFPAMSLRFPLNRQDIVTLPAIVAQIKARMNPQIFRTTHYMPINRSMSPGKRKLLFAYLDQQLPQPSPIAGSSATPPARGPTV